MSNQFDCHKFIEKFSFPRLPGSEGETKAQELIETELESLKIDNYQKESFIYTKFFMNYILRVYNFLIGLQMIILIILIYFQAYFIVVFLSLVLLFTAFFSREIREKIQFKYTKIGKKRTSYNYIIDFPAKEKDSNKTQNIIFLAHYDSISMRFHVIFDGAIFFISLVGGTIFSLHVFLITIFYILNLIKSIEILHFIYGGFFIGFFSLQLFNKRHNKSCGTADNGTAVANILHNIHFFSNNPLENTNLIFVLTGAEEMGDYGADAFIKKYSDKLNIKSSYFFIVDTIAANKRTNLYAHSQGVPKKEFSPLIKKNIEHLIQTSKKSYKIKPMFIPPLIHFSTDHAPLKKFGYNYMIFLSNGHIHSEKDNINNYFPEMLDDFNSFSKDLIIQMEKNLFNRNI